MKFSAKAAGLSLLAITYAACGFAVFRRHETANKPGTVTIRLSQWQLESGVREAMDAIIHRYEQLHPRVHVVQIPVPGGPLYTSWVLTQMAGGTAPDLVEYSSLNPDVERFFQPLSKELMAPNPYDRGTPLEHIPWRETFVDDLISPDCYNLKLGEYYGIPLNTNTCRIVYNLPLLKKITGSDKPPATYREMLATCGLIRQYAAAHREELVPIANSQFTYPLITWMMQNAMTLPLTDRIDFRHRMKLEPQELGEDYLRGDWSYDSPEIVALLHELKEFGAMCTAGFWQRERDAAVTDFVANRAVMISAPSWEATNLLALCRFPIGAFAFPYPDQTDPVYGRFARGPFSDGQLGSDLPLYLNRNTRHRAEALDFLHFMSSVEGDTIFTNVSNWPPAVKGVKPSAFAAKFAFNTDGNCQYGNFLAPSNDADALWFVQSHYAALWSPGGSVQAFRKIMREGMGDNIRSDLRLDVVSNLENIAREDVIAAATVELAAPGHRPEVLPLVSVTFAAEVYQVRAVLGQNLLIPDAPAEEPLNPAGPEPNFLRGAAELGSSRHSPALSGTTAEGEPRHSAATAGTPSLSPGALAPGWRSLINFHADAAADFFQRRLSSADPAQSRPARFGRGVALLDRQPISPSQIEEARQAFANLAQDDSDDSGQGALFFLGRVAQFHTQPDHPSEAAREYLRLIAGHPSSVWAQSALGPLALLEIYDLGSALTPAIRIARAEQLAALALTPSAACQVESEVADAIFFYRLPPEQALPHLLAAERTGRVDRLARTEMLVQIAELSHLEGDNAQAIDFYRRFLAENPADYRCWMIKKRIATLSAAPGHNVARR